MIGHDDVCDGLRARGPAERSRDDTILLIVTMAAMIVMLVSFGIILGGAV